MMDFEHGKITGAWRPFTYFQNRCADYLYNKGVVNTPNLGSSRIPLANCPMGKM